jgi:hypothetical protein
MRELGISSREDLDRLCYHEPNDVINEYLFLKSTQRGSVHERLDINPDGPRSRARAKTGDHEVWYPRRAVEELRLRLLAGGHEAGTPEAEYWKHIQHNTQYRRFKDAQIKALAREREEGEAQHRNQMRLRLAR